MAAIPKPTKGEINNDSIISKAFLVLTPSLIGISASNALAKHTPNNEPISVWELEAGIPKYQVPKF